MLVLTDEDHVELSTLCAAANGPDAPDVVVRTVALLIGAAPGTAGHAVYDAGSDADGEDARTQWSVWVTTADLLAHVDVEISSPGYDAAEENEVRLWEVPAPEMTVHSGWVRTLESIDSLHIDTPADALESADHADGASTLVVPRIVVGFRDGGTTSIPSGLDRSSDPRSAGWVVPFLGELRRGLSSDRSGVRTGASGPQPVRSEGRYSSR